MTIERIRTIDGLADAVGPFSHAVVANGMVYTSGQLPVDASGEQPEGIEAQVEAAILNLRTVLEAAGSDLEHVVSVRGFLADPSYLEPYNRVYAKYFGGHEPVRTTVGVALWGVSMEIDCVAVVREAA